MSALSGTSSSTQPHQVKIFLILPAPWHRYSLKVNGFYKDILSTATSLFGQQPQRGQSPVEHRGNLFVHIIRPSVRMYVRPPSLILRASSPLGPILTQILPNSPNPSNMAQI